MSTALEAIQNIPCFSCIEELDQARLLSFMEIVDIEKGQTVYAPLEKAEDLFFLVEGNISLFEESEPEEIISPHHFFGKESLYGYTHFKQTAKAVSDCKLLKIHASRLHALNKTYPDFLVKILKTFEKKDSIEDTQHSAASDTPSPKVSKTLSNQLSHFRTVMGWILAGIIPLVVYHLLGESVSHPARLFLTFVSGGVVLWIFNIVPEFVPGLLIILTTLILGLVPSHVALSGFASETYLLILSFSGLACIVIHSGILYRFLVYLINFLPRKQSWYDVGFLIFGGLLTPVIPSIVSRTQLAAPLIGDVMNILNIQKGSLFATRLGAAAFYGMSIFSSIFITGSIMNFIAIGLLPLQEVYQINSIGWTKAALIPGLILFLTNIITLSLWFHNRDRIQVSKTFFKDQKTILGGLRAKEKQALFASALFVFAILSINYHQVNVGWLSLFLFFSLCAMNLLDMGKWAKTVDWSFLLFVGTVIGLAETLKFLDINELIKMQLLNFFNFKDASPHGLLTIIIALILLLRLVLPIGTTFVVMMTLTIPISELFNISPWVITFTILLVSDTWFFPYQSPFYNSFVRNFEEGIPYNQKSFLSFNLVNNAARILSIYLSLPYWQYLGLL